MKLTLFYIAYALLVSAFVFHVIGVSTTSWWRSGNELFGAGLWKICLRGAGQACVDYMKVLDTTFNGTTVYITIGGLSKGYRKHLNVIRTLVLLFVVLIVSLLLVTTLILHFICRGSKVSFPRWLKLSIVISEAVSVGVGLSIIIVPTRYEKIFKHQDISLKGSWVCVVFSNIFNLLATILLVIIFINDVNKLKGEKSRKTVRFSNKEMVKSNVRAKPVIEIPRHKQIKSNNIQNNEHDEFDATNRLEWDDTNWKIDEYANNRTKKKPPVAEKRETSHTEQIILHKTTREHVMQLEVDKSTETTLELVETTNTAVERKVSKLTELSRFSEVDLGRLQDEDFRNKSVRVKSSSFENKIPCYLPVTKDT